MSDDNNRLLMQTKDISVIIGIITILVYLFGLSRHTTHWDDVVTDMVLIKTTVAANTSAIALLQSHYDDIKTDLTEIKRNTRN